MIVGLGNPGPTYASTRHNVGYMVAETLAARIGGGWKTHKSRRADVVEGHLDGNKVIVARARSYMNESGGPVKLVADYYSVEPAKLIVIHDELDIGFGALRVKFGGGDNGHNGLKSIRQSVATGDYFRIRVGIGRPQGRQTVHDFVLNPFSSTERRELPVYLEEAVDAVESLMTVGLEATQSTFNR